MLDESFGGFQGLQKKMLENLDWILIVCLKHSVRGIGKYLRGVKLVRRSRFHLSGESGRFRCHFEVFGVVI